MTEHVTLAAADVVPVAALIADAARSSMLWALSDGRALTAGELARLAGVSAATASEHLAKLVAGGLVAGERHGRHRYYRLIAPEVVAAMEALAVAARPAPPRSAGEAYSGKLLRFARTCYDHLAGYVGVAITDALVERDVLRLEGRAYAVTAQGAAWFAELGIDVDALRSGRRAFARACLDWSERRYHLAGALGARLCERLIALEWLARQPGTRALRVTNAGRRALQRSFGIRVL
ncbi:MAG: winged helix-turn-helix transcriptional regulator [Gemmatimonadaceae bacterium]|nr:winged helix-turn-helix transcriptional regulator [Gemmatimonadaceae bacterium]